MPLYEYECLQCGAQFEKLIRSSADASSLKCPECGSNSLEERFSSFASPGKPGATGAGSCAPKGGG
jgi:putative FmdB family regulatory protein